MAKSPDSAPTPEVHRLEGSSPPGGGKPTFRPAPKPRPQIRPRLRKHPLGLRDVSDEAEVINLAGRLVRLLKRRAAVQPRLRMLRQQVEAAHPRPPLPVSNAVFHAYHDEIRPMEEQIGLVRLRNASSRMAKRIDRWTRKLAATKAPTAKAAAMKGAALIETAIVEGRREDPFDALALSIAHDKLHLGLEAECLPADGGDFGSYHQEIVRLHQAIKMADTEEEADALMARWAEVDRTAMLQQPKTMADAIGALAYARREFVQFEMKDDESQNDPSHRLVLHLLDGALAVLNRVAQTAELFGAYQDMARAAEIRLLSAGATLARQQGAPEAQPGYDKPKAAASPDRPIVTDSVARVA